MGAIKDIAFAFCVTAVISAAVGLLGAGRLQKSLRYIVSLTIICSVLSVAVGKKFNLFTDLSSQSIIEYDETPLCEYQAEYLVAELLKKEKISFQNIKAYATKYEDGSIVINKIEITGCKSPTSAEKALRDKGIDCDLLVVE